MRSVRLRWRAVFFWFATEAVADRLSPTQFTSSGVRRWCEVVNEALWSADRRALCAGVYWAAAPRTVRTGLMVFLGFTLSRSEQRMPWLSIIQSVKQTACDVGRSYITAH